MPHPLTDGSARPGKRIGHGRVDLAVRAPGSFDQEMGVGMQLRVIETLNAGGQGTVHRATDVVGGEDFALKYLKPGAHESDRAAALRRFTHEVRCQSQLKHPGIVGVVAVSFEVDPPWFLMRLADHSLRDLLDENPEGLPEDEALRIFELLLEALKHAHAEGISHRNLKPENILFYGDQPAIADFGLGRTSVTQYSAPEQLLEGHDGDVRSDLFTVGTIFHQMLSGQPPLPTLNAELVPSRYRWIIEHCNVADSNRRYQSVEEILTDLTILTSGRELRSSPTDRASAHLATILSGDTAGGIKDFHRLLEQNRADQVLFLDFFVHVPHEVLALCHIYDPHGFATAVGAFTEHCTGKHVRSFADALAVFLGKVHEIVEDRDTRALVLATVRDLAAGHDGPRVREVFGELGAGTPRVVTGALQIA